VRREDSCTSRQLSLHNASRAWIATAVFRLARMLLRLGQFMEESDRSPEALEPPRTKREPELPRQGRWDDAYKWLVVAVALGPLVSAGVIAVNRRWDERATSSPATRAGGTFDEALRGSAESTYVDVVPTAANAEALDGVVPIPMLSKNPPSSSDGQRAKRPVRMKRRRVP
jgi:hypothetical protein